MFEFQFQRFSSIGKNFKVAFGFISSLSFFLFQSSIFLPQLENACLQRVVCLHRRANRPRVTRAKLFQRVKWTRCAGTILYCLHRLPASFVRFFFLFFSPLLKHDSRGTVSQRLRSTTPDAECLHFGLLGYPAG